MKQKSLQRMLLLGLALSGSLAYGQGSLCAGPKKARTLEDYKPGTLKKIAANDSKRDGVLPFRVRAVFEGFARPISKTSNDALHHWAQCCAGSLDHYTKSYIREMRFVENGAVYWLPVRDSLIADLQRELKPGDAADLFLIRVSARMTNGKRSSVLLVERFQKVEPTNDYAKESLSWIKINLPSYSEKKLKVDVPRPCQLSITDSSNRAGVSKGVIWLNLIGLERSKVTVASRQGRDMWELSLHTIEGKSAIRFMLYQGGPAEGGETNKYSLTIPMKERAEAMAEGFRRAISLCAAAKTSVGSKEWSTPSV